MPDIKWIHLTTDIFDDEKIRLIEAMPDADTLLVIWVKLLCQAGKINSSGYIFLAEDLPFTDENLATIFNRPINTIRLALKTFQRLRMIEINDDGVIYLKNWPKHQNIDGLDKIREQTRIRVARHREKQKMIPSESVTLHETLHALPDKIRIDKNTTREDSSSYIDIFNFFYEKGGQLSNKTGTQLALLVDDYGDEKVVEAIKTSAIKSKLIIEYIAGVLKNSNKGKKKGTGAYDHMVKR